MKMLYALCDDRSFSDIKLSQNGEIMEVEQLIFCKYSYKDIQEAINGTVPPCGQEWDIQEMVVGEKGYRELLQNKGNYRLTGIALCANGHTIYGGNIVLGNIKIIIDGDLRTKVSVNEDKVSVKDIKMQAAHGEYSFEMLED